MMKIWKWLGIASLPLLFAGYTATESRTLASPNGCLFGCPKPILGGNSLQATVVYTTPSEQQNCLRYNNMQYNTNLCICQ